MFPSVACAGAGQSTCRDTLCFQVWPALALVKVRVGIPCVSKCGLRWRWSKYVSGYLVFPSVACAGAGQSTCRDTLCSQVYLVFPSVACAGAGQSACRDTLCSQVWPALELVKVRVGIPCVPKCGLRWSWSKCV